MKNNTFSSPRELAKELLSTVAAHPHPYVMYSNEDIPTLRGKVLGGISKKAYERMLITAEAYMTRSGTLTPDLHPAVGRYFQSRFAYLILTGVISGEDKYLDKALELAVTSAESGNMELFVNFNNALSVGDFAHAYALAYDALYDRMTEEQRLLMRRTMEALGDWIYTNSPLLNTWGSAEPRRQAWNWNVITHGALGLVALALGDHEDWLTLSIERLQGYCRYAVDATGAAMEGLHYIGFALNTLTPLSNAIHRLTGIELMDAFPAIQMLPYWSMDMTVPFGGAQTAIGQGNSIGNYSATYYIINRYRQADALWGWLRTYDLLGNKEFSTEYEGNGWSLPAIILFEDQTLIPQVPDEEKHPLIKTYAKGIVIARDSRKADASMATFTCGYGYAGCWNHPDDTTFTFYAKGEAFVIDLGAGRKTSAEHNVILVDGEGMDYIAGATMVVGDMEQNSILENGDLYLRGNNTDSYAKIAKLALSRRHLIYSGGEMPLLLAYDVASKEGTHTYSTNFYTAKGNRVSIADGGDYCTIEGSNTGSLCYVFAYSPGGVTLSHTPTDNGLTTSSTADCHRQLTLFVAADKDAPAPSVSFASDADTVSVTVSSVIGGKTLTKTYKLSQNSIEYPTVAESNIPSNAPAEVLSSIAEEAKFIPVG